MIDTISNWIGVYNGSSATPPTSYTDYNWLKLVDEETIFDKHSAPYEKAIESALNCSNMVMQQVNQETQEVIGQMIVKNGNTTDWEIFSCLGDYIGNATGSEIRLHIDKDYYNVGATSKTTNEASSYLNNSDWVNYERNESPGWIYGLVFGFYNITDYCYQSVDSEGVYVYSVGTSIVGKNVNVSDALIYVKDNQIIKMEYYTSDSEEKTVMQFSYNVDLSGLTYNQ